VKSDVVKLVLNPALERLIPAAARAKLDTTSSRIERGALRPPRIEFVDTSAATAR
jgi:hypothetical protein